MGKQTKRIKNNKKTIKDSLIFNAQHTPMMTQGISSVFPMQNTLFELDQFVRFGGVGPAGLTNKAIEAGYDGIKVGDETVIFTVIVASFPIVFVGALQGTRTLDGELKEMVDSFGLNFIQKFTNLYFPHIFWFHFVTLTSINITFIFN